MTNCSAMNGKAGYYHTHRHLLFTLLLTLLTKVAKFRIVKHKASINAISIRVQQSNRADATRGIKAIDASAFSHHDFAVASGALKPSTPLQ